MNGFSTPGRTETKISAVSAGFLRVSHIFIADNSLLTGQLCSVKDQYGPCCSNCRWYCLGIGEPFQFHCEKGALSLAQSTATAVFGVRHFQSFVSETACSWYANGFLGCRMRCARWCCVPHRFTHIQDSPSDLFGATGCIQIGGLCFRCLKA